MRKLFVAVIIFSALMTGVAQSSGARALSQDDPARLNTIVLTLLMTEIRDAVNAFYAPYLIVPPTVVAFYGCEITGIDGEANGSHFTVTAEVSPFIGPHIAIGRDRLTLSINPLGNVTVKSFEHLESGTLPWNLQPALKKPLP